MENSNTKTWQIILGLIIVAVIAYLLVKAPDPVAQQPNSEEPVVETDPFDDPNVKAEQLCYIWNTEAGDRAQLSMDIRGGEVIGEFNWLPAEKDKKTGVFVGNVTGSAGERMVNAWWEASGEGMTNQEQIIIKFGNGIAAVGFGEMKQLADGRWAYADQNNLSFAPNLSETDCGDSAMD